MSDQQYQMSVVGTCPNCNRTLRASVPTGGCRSKQYSIRCKECNRIGAASVDERKAQPVGPEWFSRGDV